MSKTRIFIETGNKKTPEHNFIHYLLRTIFGDSFTTDVEIINVGGKDNLKNAANQFAENTNEGGKNLLIFDSDFTGIDNGGYEARKKFLEAKRLELKIEFEMFLFPNNKDDGEFETLLDKIVNKDLHQGYFNCFEAYENCIKSHTDDNGVQKYNTPNLKGKLHTLMTSVKLSKEERDVLGSGQWLFDNKDYWDIDHVELDPLKEFIRNNMAK